MIQDKAVRQFYDMTEVAFQNDAAKMTVWFHPDCLKWNNLHPL